MHFTCTNILNCLHHPLSTPSHTVLVSYTPSVCLQRTQTMLALPLYARPSPSHTHTSYLPPLHLCTIIKRALSHLLFFPEHHDPLALIPLHFSPSIETRFILMLMPVFPLPALRHSISGPTHEAPLRRRSRVPRVGAGRRRAAAGRRDDRVRSSFMLGVMFSARSSA